MPQKPVVKGKKIEKKGAANKHGKGGVTKKGRLDIAPKKQKAAQLYKEQKEITKMINANNESTFASKAESAGGKLKALKAPIPVLAPKDAKKTAGSKAETDDMEAE